MPVSSEYRPPSLQRAVGQVLGLTYPTCHDIEIPVFVLKLGGLFKPRYLFYQYEVRGAATLSAPTVIYADVFYTRSRAVKAAKAADERIRVKIGNYYYGKRKPSQLVKLPTDDR